MERGESVSRNKGRRKMLWKNTTKIFTQKNGWGTRGYLTLMKDQLVEGGREGGEGDKGEGGRTEEECRRQKRERKREEVNKSVMEEDKEIASGVEEPDRRV